jgi:Rad3-related DNA helicase
MHLRLADEFQRQTPFRHVVVDEAHRLEEAAQQANQIEYSAQAIGESLSAANALVDDDRFRQETAALETQFSHLLEQAGGLLAQNTDDSRLRSFRPDCSG